MARYTLVCLLLLLLPALAESSIKPSVEEIRQGNKIILRLSNPNPVPMTVDFSARLSGATTRQNPRVVVCPANGSIDAMVLKLGRGAWTYKYNYNWLPGDYRARHKHRAYRLPFEKGQAREVFQGYNGGISHFGPDKYSLDFSMPVGTPVLASRAGKVVRIKSDSNRGGPKPSFKKFGNYVTVLHRDGTMADYYHLKQHGVAVRLGQNVEASDLLGYSGNTGYSSGPHLHFMVYRASKDARNRTSLPVKFSVANARNPQTLVEGQHYKIP